MNITYDRLDLSKLNKIEKKAMLECMKIEYNLTELSLEIYAMEQIEVLEKLNSDSTGAAIYHRYGFAWMMKKVNDIEIAVPVLTETQEHELNSPKLRVISGGGLIINKLELMRKFTEN